MTTLSNAADRQRRYRTSRRLVSIDIGPGTSEVLAGLRKCTGLTTDALLAAALEAYAAGLASDGLQAPGGAIDHSPTVRDEGSSKHLPRPRQSKRPASPGDDGVTDRPPPSGAARPLPRAVTDRVSGPRRRSKKAMAPTTDAPTPPPQGSLDLFGERET